eukprot:357377-Chlamydomonas_euryale.AAC.4
MRLRMGGWPPSPHNSPTHTPPPTHLQHTPPIHTSVHTPPPEQCVPGGGVLGSACRRHAHVGASPHGVDSHRRSKLCANA